MAMKNIYSTVGILAVVLSGMFLIYTYPNEMSICVNSIRNLPGNSEKAYMEMHVVVTFPLLENDSRKDAGLKNYPLKSLGNRMQEYITVLQRTLDHQYVSNVHFLYANSDLVNYVKSNITNNIGKLSFHKIKGGIVGKSALEFAFTHLQGNLVMLNQADVYPVEGLDLVKKDVMISKKLMYALTRHGRLEEKCDMRKSSTSSSCDPKKYRGSHDTYIFVPTVPLEKKELNDKLNVRIDSYGIDNVHVWYFQSVLHYKVLNPCLVIKMYHLHCTGLRKRNRIWVNKHANGRIGPTSELI